jgi:4-amino-4-deoxy-L-arabinose transferase-like glycosyltransferase
MREDDVSPSLDSARAAGARWVIAGYFVTQLCVRLLISPNLEVDDAEMVGQIGWALGYPNSHPPLFHWIVRICHDLFGYWPAATAIPKYALLTVAFLLVFDTAQRATASATAGAVAAAFLFFVPIICWKSQGKLTHSILGLAATAATLHAMVLVLTRPRLSTFAWLGFALSIGLLAKYNFLFVIAALALAVICVPEVRRLFRCRAALLALVIPLLLSLPHWLWVWVNPGPSTENLYRLNIHGSLSLFGMKLGATSVWDGLIRFVFVIAVSAAPMFLIFIATMSIFRREKSDVRAPEPAIARQMRKLLGWMLLAELAVFIVVVFAGGFSQVHERYLVVLLPPLPLWLALQWKAIARPRGAAVIISTAVVLAAVMTVLRPLSIVMSRNRLALPYAEMAPEIAKLVQAPAAIIARRHENAANIAIRIAGLTISSGTPSAPRLIVVADDPVSAVSLGEPLRNKYEPASEIVIVEKPWRWHTNQMAQLAVQCWKQRTELGESDKQE